MAARHAQSRASQRWSGSPPRSSRCSIISQQVLPSGTSFSADIGPFAEIRLYFQWRGAQKNPNHTQLKDWLPAPLYARFEALKARFDPHDSGIEELRPSFAALRNIPEGDRSSGTNRTR